MTSPRSSMTASAATGGPAQLDFGQAMADFKIMFPGMDSDVIEAVLRSNSGAVDTTIDQLLAMTADNEESGQQQQLFDTPPPEYCANPLPSYQQAVRREGQATPDLLDSLGASGGPPQSPQQEQLALCERRGWIPPLLGKLPPDFLRLRPHQQNHQQRQGHSYSHSVRPPSSSHHQLSQEMLRERMSENQRRLGDLALGGETSSNEQMLEDEKFAIMLQNEEFMAELRGNREFLSALEAEASADSYYHHHQQQPQHHHLPATKKTSVGGLDDAAFREKLKTMGKHSRQTFSRLAHLFSRQKGATRLLGHAPAPSKDNLLLSAEPLVEESRDSDESDEEKHSTTKGRKYQLM